MHLGPLSHYQMSVRTEGMVWARHWMTPESEKGPALVPQGRSGAAKWHLWNWLSRAGQSGLGKGAMLPLPWDQGGCTVVEETQQQQLVLGRSLSLHHYMYQWPWFQQFQPDSLSISN